MSKVFLHVHDEGKANWVNTQRDFGRVPIENEFLATSIDSDWYKVELVVHTPFQVDCEAEVYAVKVPHNDIKKEKLNTQILPIESQINKYF